MRAPVLSAAVCVVAVALHAADKRDLALFVPKAAAAIKAAIPGSEAEVQGRTALVKKRTTRASSRQAPAPDLTEDPSRRTEVPMADGVMFLISFERYWPTQPFAGHGVRVKPPVLPKTPLFDRQRLKPANSSVARYYRTSSVQVFPDSDAVVRAEIIFGERTDTQMLEHAYAELTRFVASEL
jgi:hypothetical protein